MEIEVRSLECTTPGLIDAIKTTVAAFGKGLEVVNFTPSELLYLDSVPLPRCDIEWLDIGSIPPPKAVLEYKGVLTEEQKTSLILNWARVFTRDSRGELPTHLL